MNEMRIVYVDKIKIGQKLMRILLIGEVQVSSVALVD